jgi:hypothetical protein
VKIPVTTVGVGVGVGVGAAPPPPLELPPQAAKSADKRNTAQSWIVVLMVDLPQVGTVRV